VAIVVLNSLIFLLEVLILLTGNDDATCVIPYVLVRDVALAAGDPIGPPGDIGPTINAFRAFCEENGRRRDGVHHGRHAHRWE
jgi:hypothetical protein